MTRNDFRLRVLKAIGLSLIVIAFASCDRGRPAASAPPKSTSAPTTSPNTEQKSNQASVDPPKREASPIKVAEEKQEPKQEPSKPTPGEPAKQNQNAAAAPADQPMREPQAGQVVSEPKKEEDAPGFLPNEAPERKFPFQIPPNWKRLSEKEEIWIDNQEKLVIVSGRICLNRGLLEMFACPKGMKEHESVVATYPIAMYVHQALLLVGANPGRTVQWEPEYKPAEGPKVQIECWFYDEKNELVKRNAKEMVKLVSDGSPLKIDWVFGGSKFIVDSDGRELYAANGGELICLSNFSSAMIDLPISSTAEAGGLLFEANSEKIPPLDTPVLLVLKPEIPATGEKAGEGSGGK
jgi:hypothetical protein